MDEERTAPVNTTFPEEEIAAQLPALPEESPPLSDPIIPAAEETSVPPRPKNNPVRRIFHTALANGFQPLGNQSRGITGGKPGTYVAIIHR